jgi:signal transduction histidine kinase
MDGRHVDRHGLTHGIPSRGNFGGTFQTLLAEAPRSSTFAGRTSSTFLDWFTALRARADRAIALGRVLLAMGVLFAIWLDPSQPSRWRTFTYSLLMAYAAYALLVAVHVCRSAVPRVRRTLGQHVSDLGAFTLFMHLTGGPTSPFFVFLIFALLAGTLHWQWRGALWTALACVVILALLGVADMLDALAPVDPEFNLRTFIIRLVYLTTIAALLAWLGAHQEQVRTELWRLAAHVPPPPDPGAFPARIALEHAASVLLVPRALLVWADPEEPWTFLAAWDGERLREKRAAPNAFAPWVAAPLQDASFLTTAASTGAALIHRRGSQFEDWRSRGATIHPDLVSEFAMQAVLTVPLRAGEFEARLFLLDLHGPTLDDVLIAEVVAKRIEVLVEQVQLLDQLRSTAAIEERVRIARDLHDGALQSLAGTALQLRSVMPLVGSAPHEAVARLGSIQEALVAEQSELRSFISALGPEADDAGRAGIALAPQLTRVAKSLGRRWGVEVRCEAVPAASRLDPRLVQDLGRILAEATANAVRHGGASVIAAAIRLEDGTVTVEIADNGCGFPFTGRLDEAELAARELTPRSLHARAAARGSSLAVTSGHGGTQISIILPLKSPP